MQNPLESMTNGIDDTSLLAVVKTFLESRGWTVAPGRDQREDSPADQDKRALCRAAVKFAVSMSGHKPARYRRAVDLVERTLIAFAMQHHDGNQSAAAEYLGMHRNTLRKKLRELSVPARVSEGNGHAPGTGRVSFRVSRDNWRNSGRRGGAHPGRP